jgi:hypothetical protein
MMWLVVVAVVHLWCVWVLAAGKCLWAACFGGDLLVGILSCRAWSSWLTRHSCLHGLYLCFLLLLPVHWLCLCLCLCPCHYLCRHKCRGPFRAIYPSRVGSVVVSLVPCWTKTLARNPGVEEMKSENSLCAPPLSLCAQCRDPTLNQHCEVRGHAAYARQHWC